VLRLFLQLLQAGLCPNIRLFVAGPALAGYEVRAERVLSRHDQQRHVQCGGVRKVYGNGRACSDSFFAFFLRWKDEVSSGRLNINISSPDR